jgi:hypothetical protein
VWKVTDAEYDGRDYTAGAPVLPPPPGQQAQKNVRAPPPQVDLVATPQFSGVGEPALVAAKDWSRVRPIGCTPAAR